MKSVWLFCYIKWKNLKIKIYKIRRKKSQRKKTITVFREYLKNEMLQKNEWILEMDNKVKHKILERRMG